MTYFFVIFYQEILSEILMRSSSRFCGFDKENFGETIIFPGASKSRPQVRGDRFKGIVVVNSIIYVLN